VSPSSHALPPAQARHIVKLRVRHVFSSFYIKKNISDVPNSLATS